MPWICVFRLHQEVDLVSVYLWSLCMLKESERLIDCCNQIYPARWNPVKVAYIYCRYFPLVIAPFHLWGLVCDHELHVCESYYLALYACKIPTVRPLYFRVPMISPHD